MWWNIAFWLNRSLTPLYFNKKPQSWLMHTVKCCSAIHLVNWRALYGGVCVVSSERLRGAAVEGRDGSGAASEQTASLLPTVMIIHARYSAQISTLLRHDSIQALNTTPCYIIIKKWWYWDVSFWGQPCNIDWIECLLRKNSIRWSPHKLTPVSIVHFSCSPSWKGESWHLKQSWWAFYQQNNFKSWKWAYFHADRKHQAVTLLFIIIIIISLFYLNFCTARKLHGCSNRYFVSHCNINCNLEEFFVLRNQKLLTLVVTTSWRCSSCQLMLWCDCCVLLSSIYSQTCNRNTGPALIMILNWEQ